MSLPFFDFRSSLDLRVFAVFRLSLVSLQFFLEELCPNVVFTALVGSENSWWNLLFVSKKVDLVDFELLAVDLVDLK